LRAAGEGIVISQRDVLQAVLGDVVHQRVGREHTVRGGAMQVQVGER
jgi:hypothetical protein